MQKAIIGKKVGMTQIFDENGHVIPVTVIEAGPCVVAQKKTIENDGYVSVQLAYGEVAEKKLSKRHLQGSWLSGRHQEMERTAHPDDPRRRPGPPSCRFHGLLLRSFPYLQG